jgi:hypothetical protein
MTRNAVRLRVFAFALGVGLCFARAFAADTDAFLGTWILNPAKSQVPAGALPSSASMVVTDLGGGKFKSTSETSMAGQQIHSEITFAADGKDYVPVTTPAPAAGGPQIAESFERVNATTYKTALKLAGLQIATILEEISADGKTLTMTTTGAEGTPAAGVKTVMVFERK